MEFLVALGILGMLTYELITGEMINEKSVQRVISRKKQPVKFWFAVSLQVAILVWMLLELFGVVDVFKL